ncbi:hypothetical protein V6U89_17115 [Micromonospora sp. CPCC 206171]|uniref:hypothetical protein n=1 Tax=Micromonospora sp. CPCC 206171 TaxID=3122405 RepID=UPI002FF1073B
MLKTGTRPWWLVAGVLVVALGLLVGAAFLVWPFIRYPVERAAAAHLDEVSVDRADYLGEGTSDKDAASRLWIRRDSAEVEPLPTYDGRPLRQDHGGRAKAARMPSPPAISGRITGRLACTRRIICGTTVATSRRDNRRCDTESRGSRRESLGPNH